MRRAVLLLPVCLLADFGPPQLTLPPTQSVPNGVAGSTYSAQLQASGGSGSYQWSGSGLPNGLSLSNGGAITGTPATPGIFTCSVTVTDVQTKLTASARFPIVINAALAIPTASALPNGTVGAAYTGVTFSASGGSNSYTFSGQAPAGLTISPAGTLSGTPATAGTFNFNVTVTDSYGYQASKTFSITIIPPVTIPTLSPLAPGTTGVGYFQIVSATNGTPPYTFSVPSGSLPPGLALSTGGLLSGTPLATGIFNFNVLANDSAGQQALKAFSVTIAAALAIPTASPLAAGTVGTSYSQITSATGGTPPYSFSVLSGNLPPGLTLNPDGTLNGVPGAAGTFSFTVQVLDATGQRMFKTFSIAIAGALSMATTSALAGGTVGVSYSQTITASGGNPPYTFAISSGTAPPGLGLSASGALSGIPTTAGTFSFDVTATDSSRGSITRTYQVAIAAGAPLLGASPMSLSFSASEGGDSPATQSVSLLASGSGKVDFRIVTDSGPANSTAPAWLGIRQQRGSTPARLVVSADQNGMTAGSYSGRIRIVDGSNATTDIAVKLVVTNQAAVLDAAPNMLRFAAIVHSSTVQEKIVVLSNTGGNAPLQYSTQIMGASPWITGVTPDSGQIPRNSPVFLRVHVNPQGLPVGRYSDVLRLVSPAGDVDVPIVLLVTKSGPILDVNLLGLRFQARQGGGSSSTQTFEILNTGDPLSTVSWTAEAIQGGDIFSISPASGTATFSQPGEVTVSLKPGATQADPGAYYGLIRVSDKQSVNSPQLLMLVLDLAGAGAPPPLDVSPAGLLFEAPAGSQPQAQLLTVNTSSASAVDFQAGAWTADGTAWLNVNPTSGQSSGPSPGTATVSVNTAGLASGIYFGEIEIVIAGILRTVNVVLIVQPAGTTASVTGLRPLAVCAPGKLAVTETGIVNNFAVPAKWPATLIVKLNDDCGNSVTNGNVVASFSNGDAPVSLRGDGQGNYSATWQPGSVSSQMQVTVRAAAGSFEPAVFRVLGSISQNQVPVLYRNGELNNLNPVVGAALAPGTVAQVYGSGLASATVLPNVLPLPASFNGTAVLVGGFAAPLYYLSDGQLNVQIPSELAPDQSYPIIVSANGALTLPDIIDIVPATPGGAAYADGHLIAQHSADYSLVTADHPAKPGEYLIMYLAGMGATSPAVASGQPAPNIEPLARVRMQPTVTVDGQNAVVNYAGLTPGAVGLYQINFQVPLSAHSGDLNIVITQNGQNANMTMLSVSN
jgi:uncharacterized protein (TIGR03437 family)